MERPASRSQAAKVGATSTVGAGGGTPGPAGFRSPAGALPWTTGEAWRQAVACGRLQGPTGMVVTWVAVQRTGMTTSCKDILLSVRCAG